MFSQSLLEIYREIEKNKNIGFWNVREYLANPKRFLRFPRTPQTSSYIPKSSQIFPNLPKSSQIFPNLPKLKKFEKIKIFIYNNLYEIKKT